MAGWLLVALILVLLTPRAPAQEFETGATALSRTFYRGGEDTLRAFKPVSDATRSAIVKFNVDGATVALGAVMDANGLALTKASELKPGKLTCWLASEKEVAAEVLAVDEDEDVALVRVHGRGLKAMQWGTEDVVVGQWAITPGVAETPHAVGIISALPHRIRPQRAFIGIRFDIRTAVPRIDEVREGFSAEQAGLKPGDVIVAVNGTSVTNREAVVEMLREFREGQTVKLRLQRGDQEFAADVKMMAPSADPAGDWFWSNEVPSRLTGEVSHRAQGFEKALEHDTVLQPWLCGGPLVNLEGKGIGLNIARASRVTTYALPAGLVKRLFENLKLQAHVH
jgi:serine protease Do